MPVWINRPPAPTEFAGIRLGRVQVNKPLEAIITCDHLVGAITHFARRRTQPCTGADCPWCLDAIPGRWHGYLSVLSTRTRSQYILELTALAAVAVADYEERKGSLRGAMIVATRIGNKPNSPVTCTVSPSDADLRTLPRGVNLEKFLCTIWHVPPVTPDPEPPVQPGRTMTIPLPADRHPTSPEALRFPLHPALTERRKGNGEAP